MPSDPGGGKGEGHRSSLVEWLADRGLLRGPLLYADYWASVFRLRSRFRDEHVRRGLVDPELYRIGLDRPDVEVPRLRHYLVLFVLGPFLLPFRAFRRLGRYRLEFRSAVAEEVNRRLAELELDLAPAGEGRVDVEAGGNRLAGDLIDPYRAYGFASFFFATYKLPLAFLLSTLVAVAGPWALAGVEGAGSLLAIEVWAPAAFLAMVLLLRLLTGEWVTAVLGALPVVAVRFLYSALRPGLAESWPVFGAAVGGLFLLYLAVDWFFMPRPVPPVLMLYTSDGPGRPYERAGDAPWWLEGEAYWVWRYLVLTPAELNKFWERDWERVELWVRADGDEAGQLEWVVTDAHYRELWVPYERLEGEQRRARQAKDAREARRRGRPLLWLLEVDADLVFHTPFFRAVSLVAEGDRVPTREIGHVLATLWESAESDDPEAFRSVLERIRLRHGIDVFEDVPEAASGLVARHLLAQPWTCWRYPRGAATRREPRLYGWHPDEELPLAADPRLQVKRPAGPAEDLPGEAP